MDREVESHGGEVPANDISGLPAELGLDATPEILAVREAVVAAMTARDWDAINATVAAYQDLSMAIIEALDLDKDARQLTQIGIIIDKALMWREAGKLDSYVAELNNAGRYARNIDQDDLAERIYTASDEGYDAYQASISGAYKGPPTEELIVKAKREFPQLSDEFDVLYAHEPEEALEEITSLIDSHADLSEKGQDFLARMKWTE